EHERVAGRDRELRALAFLRNALTRGGRARVDVLADVKAVLKDVKPAVRQRWERDLGDRDRASRADEQRVVDAVVARVERPLADLSGLLVARARVLQPLIAASGRVVDRRRLQIDVAGLACGEERRDGAECQETLAVHPLLR